jgi:hypothetical protein
MSNVLYIIHKDSKMCCCPSRGKPFIDPCCPPSDIVTFVVEFLYKNFVDVRPGHSKEQGAPAAHDARTRGLEKHFGFKKNDRD